MKTGATFLNVVLVSPVGGPHSVRGVVGTAVMRNHRKTDVYNAQQRGLVYSRFFFLNAALSGPLMEKRHLGG